MRIVSVPPRRSNWRSSSTRKSLACVAGSKRRDFIEHDGSAQRHFQAAELSLDRAGEGAPLVPEQFRFDKFRRQAGAIDFQERRIAPGAVLVNPAREMIFAGAAFAGDQKRGGGVSDFSREFEDALRRRASAMHDIRESAARPADAGVAASLMASRS